MFVSAAPLRVHSLLPRDKSELEQSFTQQFPNGIDPKYITFKSSRLLQLYGQEPILKKYSAFACALEAQHQKRENVDDSN